MSKRDDDIFESLTNGDDVLSGLYAYSYYKEEKNKWVTNFQNNNGGKKPTEANLSSFYSHAHASIKQYREKGKEFGELALFERYKTTIEKEKNNCYNDIKKQLEEALKDHPQPSIWRGFGADFLSSLLGSIGFAIFPFLLIFMFYLVVPNFTKQFLEYIKTDSRVTDVKKIINSDQNSSPNNLVDDKTATFRPTDTIPPIK